jgi:hypothetical protein
MLLEMFFQLFKKEWKKKEQEQLTNKKRRHHHHCLFPLFYFYSRAIRLSERDFRSKARGGELYNWLSVICLMVDRDCRLGSSLIRLLNTLAFEASSTPRRTSPD